MRVVVTGLQLCRSNIVSRAAIYSDDALDALLARAASGNNMLIMLQHGEFPR